MPDERRASKKEDEVAIDRMCENNKIQISDIIKSGKEKTVTGYVALSDYSALFQ